MILNTSPQNQAVLSNVGEVGEFRIRNSAKAFNILSSGLYANKIRAIIRELSCNAVDSHIDAGRSNTPFDVHLPNQLEPWFSIRDYGTGLDHDQVTNIYTTYFESTKTNSNDFIGALGLGSKSPFSYTDNFSVTAIKNNRKGMYTAFINDKGVPSIALMVEEKTNDPSGVEIKFSVNDTSDFLKFLAEAKEVYTHFKLRPVIVGVSNFQFKDSMYLEKDIIPGVHHIEKSGYSNCQSYAIMGNIAYPIIMPNAVQNLGSDLHSLLVCGLEINFNIGELDFQASREGLSYVPSTVAAIKNKLEQVNKSLIKNLENKFYNINGVWDRAAFLKECYTHRLWAAPAKEFILKNNFPFLDSKFPYTAKKIKLFKNVLQEKYNLELRIFSKSNNTQMVREEESTLDWDVSGSTKLYSNITIDPKLIFVKNDIGHGIISRIKYHLRNFSDKNNIGTTAVVMCAVDKTKPVKYDEFLDSIYNPPMVILASSLLSEPKQLNVSKSNTAILRLENGAYVRGEYKMTWGNVGTIDEVNNPNKIYYYLPLNGFKTISKYGEIEDSKTFYKTLVKAGFDQTKELFLHGVRKQYLPLITQLKNWVNIEDYIKDLLVDNERNITAALIKRKLSSIGYNIYFSDKIKEKIKNKNSMFLTMTKMYDWADNNKNEFFYSAYSEYSMGYLFNRYLNKKLNIESMVVEVRNQADKINKNYPMLRHVASRYETLSEDIADYINLIDRVTVS